MSKFIKFFSATISIIILMVALMVTLVGSTLASGSPVRDNPNLQYIGVNNYPGQGNVGWKLVQRSSQRSYYLVLKTPKGLLMRYFRNGIAASNQLMDQLSCSSGYCLYSAKNTSLDNSGKSVFTVVTYEESGTIYMVTQLNQSAFVYQGHLALETPNNDWISNLFYSSVQTSSVKPNSDWGSHVQTFILGQEVDVIK